MAQSLPTSPTLAQREALQAESMRELLLQAKSRLKEALGTTSILDPFVEMRIQAAVMTIDAVIKW